MGKVFGELPRAVIFCLTIAWSIQTTAKKAIKLLEKEREQAKMKKEPPTSSSQTGPTLFMASAKKQEQPKSQQEESNPSKTADEEGKKALESIYREEGRHFVPRRVLFVLTNLALLIANSFLNNSITNSTLKLVLQTLFGAIMFLITYLQAKRITAIHAIKKKYGYKFANNDMKFENISKVFKVALTSMVAGILCGTSGIAPGMVLGPLFLSYNMIPQVMSGTNQFITMVSTFATVIQYVIRGNLLYGYASYFGVISIIGAFTGLKAINMYLARSGRQSIITIILTLLLTSALGSLPLNYWLKARALA